MYIREAIVSYRRLETQDSKIGACLMNSRAVASLATAWIGAEVVENFVVFAVDAKNRVVSAHKVGRGNATSCLVDVAQIARFAILSGAPSIILSHNHPSGDCTPSQDDILLTERVVAAMKLLDVRVLDHVIVTDDVNQHVSMTGIVSFA